MRNHIKWVAGYTSSVKWLVLLTTILMVTGSFADLVTVGLQQTIIDDVLTMGQYDLLLKTLILMGIAFLIHPIMFTAGPHFIHVVVARVTEDVSIDFMKEMYRIRTTDLQKERTGTYVHHIVFDAEQTAVLIGNDIPRIVTEALFVLVLFFIIGINSLLILMFSFLSILFYIYLGYYFSKKVKGASKKVQETRSDLVVHMEEGVSSTREVIAYHRMKWEKRLYDKVFGKYFEAIMQEGKLVNLQMISSEPVKWGITIFILGYGGLLVLQGEMSLGVFVILYQFSNQLLHKFHRLFNLTMGLSEKMACVERVRTVMETPAWKDGETELTGDIATIELKNVHFSYDTTNNKIMLDKLNAVIPAGKKVAIVGESGSGKSTIAQLLIRSFEPDTGEIIVNGKNLSTYYREDWCRKTAIVFQDTYLYPDTIWNNIIMGQEAMPLKTVANICKIVQLETFIASLPKKYETVIGERGVTLSGGQRQRIAIARALVRQPELLILDEATSALDVLTERKLQEEIDQLREGMTTIVIAHRLSTVQNADHIFVLDSGQIVGEGTHEMLMERNHQYQSFVLANAER